MRKALIAVVAVAALAGCGGGEESSAEETTAASSSSSSSPAPSMSAAPEPSATLAPEMRDKVFVTFLEQRGFVPTYATAEAAVDLADALCGRYDGGASYEDVVGVLLAGGVPAAEAGGFEGAAVTAFCPEHSGERTGGTGGA